MLSEFQKQKMTYYFNLMDFDNSGTLEKEDYVQVAKNICHLWEFGDNTASCFSLTDHFERSWLLLRRVITGNLKDFVTLDEWLMFADEHLVNGTTFSFNTYIKGMVLFMFDFFDTNKDGFISKGEYIDFFVVYGIARNYSMNTFSALDLNNDDLISKEELMIAIHDFFKSDDPAAPGNMIFGNF